MIKKILLFILLTITVYSASERISKIDNIYSEISEIVFLNGEKKEKKYTIEYKSSNYLRKEITFPNVNKGEISQYEDGSSKMYIPLFDEVVEDKNENDFGNFLSIINSLKEKDKNDESFRKSYYERRVKELKYQNNFTAKLKEYEVVDGYLLPVKIEIFEKEVKLAELTLKNSRVNKGVKKKDLAR